MKLIKFIVVLVPTLIGGAYHAFEASVWNWLEKEVKADKPLSKYNQIVHDFIFDTKDEIVEFEAKEFDKPNYIVDAKYDENLNRIW